MLKHFTRGVVFSCLASISLAVEPGKPLAGRVLDEHGQLLNGARVTAWGGEGPRQLATMVTSSDGRFSFPAQIRDECIVLLAAKEGKALDWALTRLVSSDETELRLGPAAAIEGVVVDSAGVPVPSAVVKAPLRLELPVRRELRAEAVGDVLTARTDEQGTFCFANLPEAAMVSFDMSASGHARALANGPFTPGQKGLRFVLPPEGRLEGTAMEKNTGRPLAHVRLKALSSVTSGQHQVETATDQEGRFQLPGLSGGNYRIEIASSAATDPAAQIWIGALDKVRVEVGKTTSGVKIEAVQGGMLEVVLLDAAVKTPITGRGMVVVCSADDLRISKWASVRDGKASLCLAPGKYVVTEMMVPGCPLKPEKSDAFQVEMGRTNRVVLPVTSAMRGQDVRSPRGKPQVSAAVQDVSGSPVPGAKVRILPVAGEPKEVVAGEDGRFTVDTVDVGPLFCFVLARHSQHNRIAIGMISAGEMPAALRLLPPAKLSGRVRDPQGEPVVGASVTAQIDGSHLGRFAIVTRCQTDKDGRYQMELAGPSAVSYAIAVKAAGYGLAETLLDSSELQSGAATAKDLVLRAADRVVRGLVRGEQGKPVPGAVVTARAGSGASYPGAAVTDQEGRFVLEQLDDAGEITLFAEVPGRDWNGSSSIRPGGADVVIRVEPSAWD